MLKTLANYGCCLLFVATGCASTSEDNLSDAATCDSAAEDCPAQSALDAAADDAQEESTANTGGTASAASDTEDTDDADSSVNCTEDRRRARIGDCDDTTNQTVLYENDFETPAAPVAATCGTVLHQGNLTELYGNGLSSQEDVSVVLLHVLEPPELREDELGQCHACVRRSAALELILKLGQALQKHLREIGLELVALQ